MTPVGLIGRWITGPQDYTNRSSFTPSGTHDGTTNDVGLGSGQSWGVDTPAAAMGSALSLNGNGAVRITNTKQGTDAGYSNTFDNAVSSEVSVAFWAKGFPGSWNSWVSKNGESAGYKVRRQGGNNYGTFTIRGTPGDDDPTGAANSNDGQWHHYAGVWDGRPGAGNRKLYIDGVAYQMANCVNTDTGPPKGKDRRKAARDPSDKSICH